MEHEITDIAKALKQEDIIGRVIRVQIHIEQLLNDCLRCMVTRQDHLDSMRLDFFNKTLLALALGLPDDFKKPLNFLGNIRNKFAHNIEYSLDKGLMNNFYKSFSETHKTAIIEYSSVDSLSWVSEGKSIKQVTADEQFMIYGMSLYYLLKLAVLEMSHNLAINEKKIIICDLSEHL